MKCGKQCEVFSRVVGYCRPVSLWNKGKQAEFKDRRGFSGGVTGLCVVTREVPSPRAG